MSFLGLPLSIRKQIYTQVVLAKPKTLLEDYSFLSVCPQIHEEFVTVYDYYVLSRFRCCLGRTMQDRDKTKFYTWNYHNTSWLNTEEIPPGITEGLQWCEVRCTIEELGEWDRKSDCGDDTFKVCLRTLVRTFKACKNVRMKVTFDNFTLYGRKGMLNADETFVRLQDLTEIPGLIEINFKIHGFNEEDFVWKKKKGKGKGTWVTIVGDKSPDSNVSCGARVPKGYGLRRGIT